MVLNRLAYDQNVNDEARFRDKRATVGQLRGRPDTAFRHRGQELNSLLSYNYALPYREENVPTKPNNLSSSFLSADGGGDRPIRRGLRCK